MSEKESKFEIAVVMPVLNEELYIGSTLEQIYMQDFPMEKVEVVIADGGSTDKTKEIVKSFKDRFGSLLFLDNPKRRSSAGRNIGVKQSTAKYVIVLDGHIHIPDKKLFSSMVEIFERTDASCLCRPQPLQPPDINEFEKSVGLCRGSILGHKPGSEIYSEFEKEVDPTSSGAMYRRDLFDVVGYFDESFDACEDVDFNYRVKKSGLKSFIAPSLRVFYYPRSKIGQLWKQMFRYGKGRFNFSKKHSIFAPIQVLAGMATLIFGLLFVASLLYTPVFDLFKTVLSIYLLIVIVFSLLLAVKEKHMECFLFGPLIFPVIHFGLGLGSLAGALKHFTKQSSQPKPIKID